MKNTVLTFLMTLLLLLGGSALVFAQDQAKPKKDTVNIDTYAKPVFYYAVEDEKKGKSPAALIALITGAVVVAGAAGLFLLKKKK